MVFSTDETNKYYFNNAEVKKGYFNNSLVFDNVTGLNPAAWNPSYAVYSTAESVFLSAISTSVVKVSSLTGIFFTPTGDRMFLSGRTPTAFAGVYAFDLSTNWDPSTATYASAETMGYSYGGANLSETVQWNPEGTRLITLDRSSRYATRWGTTTSASAFIPNAVTYIGQILYSGLESQPYFLTLNDDGLKNYIGGIDNSIYQIGFTSAYSFEGAVVEACVNISSEITLPQGLFWKPDGSKMFMTGGDVGRETIHVYEVSSPYDIAAGITYVTAESFTLQAEVTVPTDLAFKSDGLKMYVVDQTNRAVRTYNLTV